MLKVGLTGGVACGKSTVLAMFEKRGAHVIRADEIGHQLMRPGQKVYDEIVERFGRGILDERGEIVRAQLAEKAFGEARIAELNEIVHPAVVQYQNDWLVDVARRDPQGVAMIEAALMIEAGAHKHMDKLIAVTCPMEEKVRRFAARTGTSEAAARAEVERRMKAQMSDEQKAAISDFVIDNSDGVEAAERQVEEIWSRIKT